ncbi:MAG: undecaprenyl-diphosphate phosphatase [Pseudomonadota bacterium]
MTDLLQVILLGIIEGITEFLPISSTGHLLIAEQWLGHRSELFNVAIQAGAILAVVFIYWRRLWEMCIHCTQPTNRDYLLRLAVAFVITVVGGLTAKSLGLELPESIAPVAWALIIGGVVILWIERRDYPVNDEPLTWKAAIWAGLAQVLAAIFPGTSRSAATIFAAMLAGQSRVAAADFSFLIGIPTMFAATAYAALKQYKNGGFAGEDWNDLGIAFVVSTITAFVVVKWLLRYIQTHRFTVFAWYRIALGAGLLLFIH